MKFTFRKYLSKSDPLVGIITSQSPDAPRHRSLCMPLFNWKEMRTIIRLKRSRSMSRHSCFVVVLRQGNNRFPQFIRERRVGQFEIVAHLSHHQRAHTTYRSARIHSETLWNRSFCFRKLTWVHVQMPSPHRWRIAIDPRMRSYSWAISPLLCTFFCIFCCMGLTSYLDSGTGTGPPRILFWKLEETVQSRYNEI